MLGEKLILRCALPGIENYRGMHFASRALLEAARQAKTRGERVRLRSLVVEQADLMDAPLGPYRDTLELFSEVQFESVSFGACVLNVRAFDASVYGTMLLGAATNLHGAMLLAQPHRIKIAVRILYKTLEEADAPGAEHLAASFISMVTRGLPTMRSIGVDFGLDTPNATHAGPAMAEIIRNTPSLRLMGVGFPVTSEATAELLFAAAIAHGKMHGFVFETLSPIAMHLLMVRWFQAPAPLRVLQVVECAFAVSDLGLLIVHISEARITSLDLGRDVTDFMFTNSIVNAFATGLGARGRTEKLAVLCHPVSRDFAPGLALIVQQSAGLRHLEFVIMSAWFDEDLRAVTEAAGASRSLRTLIVRGVSPDRQPGAFALLARAAVRRVRAGPPYLFVDVPGHHEQMAAAVRVETAREGLVAMLLAGGVVGGEGGSGGGGGQSSAAQFVRRDGDTRISRRIAAFLLKGTVSSEDDDDAGDDDDDEDD